ncbi:4-hydroxythreonine-4-phosphate dehydrogenase PdxA [candidate division KSB1 bacterium]|nr:4-hydroxythreonine-4-phosphate dehydrogenase PdxA [candidate division KSB1 bacterium]
MTNQKTLAITIGDVNGVGPEVVLKALRAWQAPQSIRILLVGPRSAWDYWLKHLHHEFRAPVIEVLSLWPSNSQFAMFDTMPSALQPEVGKATVVSGKIAGDALIAASDMAGAGLVDAIITAPVSKYALSQAGYHYPGQTEFVAERLGAKHFAMMLMAESFRVALVTTHLPLRKIADAITSKKIVEQLHVVDHELQTRFGIAQPKIAVTGLNPHAGEGGVLGEEEQTIIAPAIAHAQREGIHAEGPFSADALFGKFAQSRSENNATPFDAYLAMYHDQGLIPLKMFGFGRAVNYTAGLPVIRISPDHGTAYDIAGQGLAQPTSMIEALKLAVALITKER